RACGSARSRLQCAAGQRGAVGHLAAALRLAARPGALGAVRPAARHRVLALLYGGTKFILELYLVFDQVDSPGGPMTAQDGVLDLIGRWAGAEQQNDAAILGE